MELSFALALMETRVWTWRTRQLNFLRQNVKGEHRGEERWDGRKRRKRLIGFCFLPSSRMGYDTISS